MTIFLKASNIVKQFLLDKKKEYEGFDLDDAGEYTQKALMVVEFIQLVKLTDIFTQIDSTKAVLDLKDLCVKQGQLPLIEEATFILFSSLDDGDWGQLVTSIAANLVQAKMTSVSNVEERMVTNAELSSLLHSNPWLTVLIIVRYSYFGEDE